MWTFVSTQYYLLQEIKVKKLSIWKCRLSVNYFINANTLKSIVESFWLVQMYMRLLATRLAGMKRESRKKTRKMRISWGCRWGRDASFYEVLRYRWRGVSCDNARYYVLPSEPAIDGTTDRSIEGTFQSRPTDDRCTYALYHNGFSLSFS